MAINDNLILLISPFLLHNIRVQVIMPAFSTLLPKSSSFEIFCDEIPFFGSVGVDEVSEHNVLFFGLNERQSTHEPLIIGLACISKFSFSSLDSSILLKEALSNELILKGSGIVTIFYGSPTETMEFRLEFYFRQTSEPWL